MNHPPLVIGDVLLNQGFGQIREPSRLNYPPFLRLRSVLRYGGRKVSHAKVEGSRAVRAGLSCCASSRRRRLVPAGFNPSAEQHGQTRPAATSCRQAGDTVTASPTPCPCSAAHYGVRQKFRMRKSSVAPRVSWVPHAARASTTAQRLAYSREPMSRFASPAGRSLTRARRAADRFPITSAACPCRTCDQDHRRRV